MRLAQTLRCCCSPLVLVFALALMVGCGDESPTPGPSTHTFTTAHRFPQGYVELPTDKLPNMIPRLNWADAYYEPLDADSIEMMTYDEEAFYQPVNMGQRCITFIATYHHTTNQKYLDRAEKYAAKIQALCSWMDGLHYLPYSFQFAVHSNSSITFEPPWYSGMAQGIWISVMVRLYEITGKQEYLDFAHKLFLSLTRLKSTGDPWVARIDEAGFYWIEEYPHNDHPGQTLNGFVYAIIGVYDYYRITKDEQAWMIWELCLTTVKHYFPLYRIPGERSYYCLGHKDRANVGYHHLHIRQARQLYQMTGDPFFSAIAEVFETDINAGGEDDS